MAKREDVRAQRLPNDLSWKVEDRAASINIVFGHVMCHAEKIIHWYLISKSTKRHCARLLRMSVILLTTAAGLIPLFPTYVNPPFATLALGLAAMCVAFDRFFGCSTAWMRFIATEHQIRQSLNEFQISCEQLKASWVDNQPDDAQLSDALEKAKAFIVDVDELVQKETEQWRKEFSDTLAQLDGAVSRTTKKS